MNDLNEYIGEECFVYTMDKGVRKGKLALKIIGFELNGGSQKWVNALLEPIEEHQYSEETIESLKTIGLDIEVLNFYEN